VKTSKQANRLPLAASSGFLLAAPASRAVSRLVSCAFLRAFSLLAPGVPLSSACLFVRLWVLAYSIDQSNLLGISSAVGAVVGVAVAAFY
jgi:hypothetical protein